MVTNAPYACKVLIMGYMRTLYTLLTFFCKFKVAVK